MHTWDPDRYLAYADERGRPFVDLLARVGAERAARRRRPRLRSRATSPPCSPTAGRTPTSLGLDCSAEMIAAARRRRTPASPARSPTCATGPPRRRAGRRARLQRHPPVGARPPRPAARAGRPGRAGRLVRLPGARQLRRAEPHDPRATSPPSAPYAEHAARRRRPRQPRPGRLPRRCCVGLGCEVDAWETTYLHVLTGEDPVFAWVSGTGARPTLQALPDGLRERVRGRVQAPAARAPTPPTRTARACCRSAGSSSSPARPS